MRLYPGSIAPFSDLKILSYFCENPGITIQSALMPLFYIEIFLLNIFSACSVYERTEWMAKVLPSYLKGAETVKRAPPP